MSVTEEVEDFSVAFKKLPKNMRLFTLCLRSLYLENTVSPSAYNAAGITNIRNQTRQEAMIYVKGILPLSTQVVRCIQEFFEYFESLELDTWKECLPDILDDVAGYQQCCTEILRMHEELMVPLKKRQNEAKLLIVKLPDINKELETKKAQLEKEADNSLTWAVRLCFVPVVGSIAAPLLCLSADGDRAKAMAEGKQVNSNDAVIMIVSKVLIPALSAFLGGINAIVGFFNVMQEELTTFHCRGGRAVEDTKRFHYVLMRSKAVEIKGSCREFYAMIPGVKTDLLCIPEKPGDLKHFNEWRIKQQGVIKKKYNQTLTDKLKTLLRHFESIEGFEQLAIKN